MFLADLFLPGLGFGHRLVAVVSSVVMVGIVAVVGRVVGVGAVSLTCCVKMFSGHLSVGLVDLESCCSCPRLHVVVILFSPPSVVGSVSGSFGDPVLAQVLKWNGAVGIDLCWVELTGSGQVVSANQPAVLDLPLILCFSKLDPAIFYLPSRWKDIGLWQYIDLVSGVGLLIDICLSGCRCSLIWCVAPVLVCVLSCKCFTVGSIGDGSVVWLV